MTDAAPYKVPSEPGRWRAQILAAVVHAALLVFLWIGVHWQNETPSTIEAEVWSPQPREAAPAPERAEPKPEPESQPKPQPKPEPPPVPKEVPKPEVKEPPVAKPDIALEQEKKRKAEEKKRQQEEQERQEKLAQEKKRVEAEKERQAKLRQEEEAREKEKAAKAERERKEKELAERKRKQELAEAQALEKMRDEELRRLSGAVTGTGGSGDAARAQGGRASAEYGSKVAAKIKSNTIYNVPDTLSGNPSVEYAVELLPDGSLRGTPRKLRSSGIPGFDEAVLRAIEKSQPFPRDERSGSVPSSFTVSHKPKDQ